MCRGVGQDVVAARSRSRASGCESSLVAIGCSTVGGEADRLQEVFELLLFGGDEVAVALEFEEPDHDRPAAPWRRAWPASACDSSGFAVSGMAAMYVAVSPSTIDRLGDAWRANRCRPA